MSLDSARRNKAARQLQAGRHLVMGIIFLGIAYLIGTFKKFGNFEFGSGTSYFIAGFLVIYGVFRIWRGIVTFREED